MDKFSGGNKLICENSPSPIFRFNFCDSRGIIFLLDYNLVMQRLYFMWSLDNCLLYRPTYAKHRLRHLICKSTYSVPHALFVQLSCSLPDMWLGKRGHRDDKQFEIERFKTEWMKRFRHFNLELMRLYTNRFECKHFHATISDSLLSLCRWINLNQ